MKKLNNKGNTALMLIPILLGSVAIGELCVEYGNCVKPEKTIDECVDCPKHGPIPLDQMVD